MYGASPQDELDGLDQAPTLSGDFYRENDDVVRGVSMAPAPPGGFGSGALGGFYDEEADAALKGMGQGGGGAAGLFPDALDFPKCLLTEGVTEVRSSALFFASKRHFAESDCPPSTPSDPFFKFSATTLYVSSVAPWQAGNSLLDFLGTDVVSSVSKISSKKFSIKADVFVGSVMCTLKIRIYCQGQDRCAIEFRRRSGDSVAFCNVYQQAAKYLESRFPNSVPASKAIAEFTNPTLGDCTGEAEGLAPILDLAGPERPACLRAEAAAALSEVASDGGRAAVAFGALEELKGLLQASEVEVAYPAARALFKLGRHPEAAAKLADEGLLATVRGKVQSETTGTLVRRELAQALESAAVCAQSQPGAKGGDVAALTMASEEAYSMLNLLDSGISTGPAA